MNAARLSILLIIPLSGCLNVKTDPIRVEPIQITMDVNLRVTRELNDFFGDLDAQSEVLQYDESQSN